MGEVVQLHTAYRWTVAPMTVTVREQGGYSPGPSKDWTPIEHMAWLAGIATMTLGQRVVLRKSAPRLPCLFSIQLGQRRPIDGLQLARVLDILVGVMEAAELLTSGEQ